MLYTMQGERRACSFELVKELDAQHSSLGVIRELPFPAVKGKPRMTAAEFCRKYKRGRFILRMAHHVACVKDGELYDTHDCSRSCVYKAWEIRPRETRTAGPRAASLRGTCPEPAGYSGWCSHCGTKHNEG